MQLGLPSELTWLWTGVWARDLIISLPAWITLWSYDWMTFFYSSQSPALRSCCQSGERIQFMHALTPAVKCWLFCSITLFSVVQQQTAYLCGDEHPSQRSWRLCLSWATTWRKICGDSILIQKWCCQVNTFTSQKALTLLVSWQRGCILIQV